MANEKRVNPALATSHTDGDYPLLLDIAFLRLSSNYHNLRDLNGRVEYVESASQKINGESFTYRDKTRLLLMLNNLLK